MTRTEEELRKEYEEYSRMYNNPKHWEGWLIGEIRKVENYLEEALKLAEFLTIEAGKHSKRCKELEHDTETLELKAAAYDRLMSGGKKTLKEWANIFGMYFAVGKSGVGYAYKYKPLLAGNNFNGQCFSVIYPEFIDYTGDWKDSLTLPDGLEEP